MNLQTLKNISKLSKDALEYIHLQKDVSLNDPTLISIISQLEFIYKCSTSMKNPFKELPKDVSFTYGIISSRALASPRELKIKEILNQLDTEMNKLL
ncbi:MAG: hypothetical protein VX341_11720 [Bdellovibrionota bacterium]|nr:hypothetical protein [Bdellovibrionota bacterium]